MIANPLSARNVTHRDTKFFFAQCFTFSRRSHGDPVFYPLPRSSAVVVSLIVASAWKLHNLLVVIFPDISGIFHADDTGDAVTSNYRRKKQHICCKKLRFLIFFVISHKFSKKHVDFLRKPYIMVCDDKIRSTRPESIRSKRISGT